MELKKARKFNLENKRLLFLGIGMTISIALAITAFEWKTEVQPVVYWVEYESSCSFPEFPISSKLNNSEFEPPSTNWKDDGTVITNDLKYKSSSVESRSDLVSITDCGFPIENSIHEPYTIVEEMPSFEGSFDKLHEFIGQNIKYPKTAQRIGIEGRVFVQFIVEKDGALTDIQVLRGVGGGFDEEAIRVMKLVPNFTPGKQRGVPVRVRMVVPVNFKLQQIEKAKDN